MPTTTEPELSQELLSGASWFVKLVCTYESKLTTLSDNMAALSQSIETLSAKIEALTPQETPPVSTPSVLTGLMSEDEEDEEIDLSDLDPEEATFLFYLKSLQIRIFAYQGVPWVIRSDVASVINTSLCNRLMNYIRDREEDDEQYSYQTCTAPNLQKKMETVGVWIEMLESIDFNRLISKKNKELVPVLLKELKELTIED